jgi:hypothetical protein
MHLTKRSHSSSASIASDLVGIPLLAVVSHPITSESGGPWHCGIGSDAWAPDAVPGLSTISMRPIYATQYLRICRSDPRRSEVVTPN